MISEKELKDKVEPIRKRVQEKWDRQYPGLQFYIIWYKENQTIYMRWQVNDGNIGQNFSKYIEVSPTEIELTIHDILIMKIEALEKDFEKWAINKALNNRIYLESFYKEREDQLVKFMEKSTLDDFFSETLGRTLNFMSDKLELLRERTTIKRQIDALDNCPFECDPCKKMFDFQLNFLLSCEEEINAKINKLSA